MTKDNIEKLKQSSEVIRDILKPIEDFSKNFEKVIAKTKEERSNPNSEYNKIMRGEKV